MTGSFDVIFDLRLIKGLSKQSWGWWFETPSYPLWRHCNVNIVHWTTSCSLIILIHFHDILINAWKQQHALPLHVGGVLQRLPLYDNLVYLVTICQYHILQHTGSRRHQDFDRFYNCVNGLFVSVTIHFGGKDIKTKYRIIYSACERFIHHKQNHVWQILPVNDCFTYNTHAAMKSVTR